MIIKFALTIYVIVLCAKLISAHNGYFYPKPTRKENNTGSVIPPPGVQGDFVDEIISGHREQILSNILTNSELLAITSTGAFTNKCASCTCGVPNVNRIVGGKEVRTNKYPWIVQLLRGTFFFCGGALINDRYILTAAHCVQKTRARDITVRLLQLDRTSSETGITRRVTFAHAHAKYDPSTLKNDIALLRLNATVPLVDPIRPICLPTTADQNFDFKEAIVAGWGYRSENGSTSSTLQEVTVPILTNAQCRATTYKSMITDTVICAGLVREGGKDSCQGDSGGPLIVHDHIFRLVGVVSYGFGCGKPNAPGVYTRVSKYIGWIAANTRDACYCSK